MRDPQEKAMPICPVCGEETDDFYMNDRNEILGCTNPGCVRLVDAWEYVFEEEIG